MKVLKFYEKQGVIIKYYLHFIFFNRWHFHFHYRNDFASSQDITEDVCKEILKKISNATLVLE